MASILIIDSRQDRREALSSCLKEGGHDVTGMGEIDGMAGFDADGIEVVVLNLYPDAFRTWEFYLAFKEKYPYLPVLVYLQHSGTALKNIRQIIASIVSSRRDSRKHISCPSVDLTDTLGGARDNKNPE